MSNSTYSSKLDFWSTTAFCSPIDTIPKEHPNDVLLWVAGSGCSPKEKHGRYYCRLEYKGKTKYLEKETPINSSANQSMILGAIDAVSQIKKPCTVCIIAPSPFGFKTAFKGKGVNAGLILKLCDLLVDKGCNLTEILCPSYFGDIRAHIMSTKR